MTGFERIGESHIYRREVEGKVETVYFENGPPSGPENPMPLPRPTWSNTERLKLALAGAVVVATAVLGLIQLESDIKKLHGIPLVTTPNPSP